MSQKMDHDALTMTAYQEAPAVLLFSDSRAGLERARRSAELLGCRISDALEIKGAAERLERQVATDAVLVEAEQESEWLISLLDRLEVGARSGWYRSVVSAPFMLLDLVAARAPHRDIIHLCDPTDHERLSAVADAAAPQGPWLHDARKSERSRLRDIGAGDEPVELQKLSDEASRLARTLASLAKQQEGSARKSGRRGAAGEIEAPQIRAMIRSRKLREQYLGSDLFADPAWDMMLDLLASQLEGRKVAVSSLCIASGVPATTALRWIKLLTDRGLLVRIADPQDGRRVYIELSQDAAEALATCLNEMRRISPFGC